MSPPPPQLPPTPLTPSPSVATPKRPLSTSSTVTSLTPERPTVSSSAKISKLDEVFRIHDFLIQDPNARDYPFTSVVAVGRQSAGKSTVLSVISGVPLYSAAGTATICPLQVHSRNRPTYSACIEIEFRNPVNGEITRLPFTHGPLPKDEIASATRVAGYQARVCADEPSRLTTYEQWKAVLSPAGQEDPLDKEKKRTGWTPNNVVLHIAGPHQANISIVDLPGLMGGANGTITRALIEAEIDKDAKSHNLILLCCAGSGSDLSPDDTLFQLVKKHDPNGSRTMCLITKADKIDDVGAIDKLVLGIDKNWDWRPLHGWWPVSPKTVQEDKEKASEFLIRQREKDLFEKDPATAGWAGLQKSAGSQFGTLVVQAKVYRVFAEMVMKLIAGLKKRLQEQAMIVDNALGELPIIEIDPVGTLHQIIFTVWEKLRSAVLCESKYTQKLYQVQCDLQVALAQTLPLFLPFEEGSDTSTETYENPTLQGWNGTGSTEYIYLDEVLQIVREHISGRDGSFNLNRARSGLIKRYAGKWLRPREEHLGRVWDILVEAETAIVEKASEERNMLKDKAIDILRDKRKQAKAKSLELVRRLCKRESQDPTQIDLTNLQLKLDYAAAKKTFENFNMDPDVPQSKVAKRKNRSGSRGELVDETENGTTSWLLAGMIRIGSLVGREAQGQVIDYLDTVMPTLRKGLGLETLEIGQGARIGRLMEADNDVVERRRTLGKRKRDLEDMRERFKEINEDV